MRIREVSLIPFFLAFLVFMSFAAPFLFSRDKINIVNYPIFVVLMLSSIVAFTLFYITAQKIPLFYFVGVGMNKSANTLMGHSLFFAVSGSIGERIANKKATKVEFLWDKQISVFDKNRLNSHCVWAYYKGMMDVLSYQKEAEEWRA